MTELKKKEKEKKPDACTQKGKSQSVCQIHTSNLFSLLLIVLLILNHDCYITSMCAPPSPTYILICCLLLLLAAVTAFVSQWGSLASNLIRTNLIVIIENRVAGSR